MVRSPSNHSPSRGMRSREARKHSPRSKPPHDRSLHRRSIERRKSPVRRSSPRRRSPIRRRNNGRQGRFTGRGGGNAAGRGRGMGGPGNQGRRAKKKWRRNKKKGRGGRPPVSGGNRQPIASMRMRMDDYLPPRADRLLPLGKGVDMDHAVARARREASTRTKDTFWTKKLLDAEATHPNRWVHSGFKELYREELGYSEHPESEDDLNRSKERKGLKRRESPGRPRSPRGQKQRSRSPRRNQRKRRKSNSSRSRSKSPRGRSKSPLNKSKRPRNSPGSRLNKGKDVIRIQDRSYSRSLSTSSNSTFSSYSSYSRSYSSYSRSSSTSSFTSSSTSSLSYRRKTYSRSSYSRSPTPRRLSPPPQLPKIKTASLSKAVQSVHINRTTHETKKKVVTKTVSNTVKVKNSNSSHSQQKIKAKMEDDHSSKKHKVDIAPRVKDMFYQKDVIGKSPPYINSHKTTLIPPIDINNDPQFFKNPPPSSYHRTLMNQKKLALSGGEEESESDSTSDDEDGPRKMTLSERFGKLAQLSSQRQEYDGVRMKIVREGGQDKKVYLEGGVGSRSPSPLGRLHRHNAHERWLREHKAEYDEYQQRYGEFRHWDPHRDLPRELPPNWDDVNVRYRYYKESGYFGDRAITMEDYLKWEEWWYRYRDWLEKYGGMQDIDYGGPYSYEGHSGAVRWSSRRGSSRDKEDRKRRRY